MLYFVVPIICLQVIRGETGQCSAQAFGSFGGAAAAVELGRVDSVEDVEDGSDDVLEASDEAVLTVMEMSVELGSLVLDDSVELDGSLDVLDGSNVVDDLVSDVSEDEDGTAELSLEN